MTATDLRNVEVQAIRLLRAGELQAREASALAQLCNSLHRVIPTADLETRVATLEEEVARRETESPPHDDSTGSNMNDTGAAVVTDTELAAEQQTPPDGDSTGSHLNETGAVAESDAQLEADQQIPPDGDSTESHMNAPGGAAGTDAEPAAEQQMLCPTEDHGSGEAEKA